MDIHTLQNHTRPTRCSSGSALVAVFWIMAVLALAVFAAVRVVYYDSDVAASQLNGFEALQVAERGIAVAVNPAVEKGDPILDWYDEEQDISFSARITSEAARFNINVLLMRQDKQLLTDIFTDWGMDLQDAQALIDNLTDWIDEGDLAELNGAEVDWYEDQGRPNHPFNRPFYNLDEMRLVKGMDQLESLQPNWRNWFTIWSNGKLDLNEAPAELISSAVEVSIDDAEDFVDHILGPDLERDTEDDQKFQTLDEALVMLGVSEFQQQTVNPRVTVSDTTTRIVSDGRAGTVKRRITLIIRSRTAQPAILERKEEILP
ncbi:general secretion pathway protein GspK [Verrucomicrobiaceae bacterium R5-34]|nr:general secretion pathway protein GspK [Verrucomicrobiaceae bacterium R5-34]